MAAISTSTRLPQQSRHRVRERGPLVGEARQLRLPRRREPVVLARHAALRGFPPYRDVAAPLEAVEDGIQRAVADLERTVGLFGERRNDLVAVALTGREQVQHDQLERPALELALDAAPVLPAP